MRGGRPLVRAGGVPAAALLVAGGLAAGALVPRPGLAAQEPLTASADLLAVRFAPSTGAVELSVLDPSGDTVTRAALPELRLDGARQGGFRVAGPGVARGGHVDVRLDVLGPRAVAVTWTARDGARHAFELRLRSDDETRYYGTGERFNALNHRGYTLPVITDDRYGNKGVGSYKPVSFFMSSRGFGVWVDSYGPGSLDLSATERFVSTLRFEDTRLRVVFLAGPDPADILAAYTGLTGRPPLPPEWAFGLWKSRDVHHNADSVHADVERLREYGIPASVLVLDSPWETGYNTFEVNRAQFPDPDCMFARVRELGFEIALWLTPFVNDSNVQEVPGIDLVSDNYREAVAAGHLVTTAAGDVAVRRWWKGRGGLVDFTDPAAIDWWHALLDRTTVGGGRGRARDRRRDGADVPPAERLPVVRVDGSDPVTR